MQATHEEHLISKTQIVQIVLVIRTYNARVHRGSQFNFHEGRGYMVCFPRLQYNYTLLYGLPAFDRNPDRPDRAHIG